jgi:hypothetical protein
MRPFYFVVFYHMPHHQLKALFIIVVNAGGPFVTAVCNDDRDIMFFGSADDLVGYLVALDAFVHDNDGFDRVIRDQVEDILFRGRPVFFPVDIGVNGKNKLRVPVILELLIYFDYKSVYLRVIHP